MKLFLHANYKIRPDMTEIRDWKKTMESIPGYLQSFPNSGEHVIWEALAIAVFKSGKWMRVSDGEFGDSLDAGANHPVIWLECVTGIVLGDCYRENERQNLDAESWLSEEISMIEWKDCIEEAAATLNPEKLHLEARLDILYPMKWESSVDYESGIDEGGFVIDGAWTSIQEGRP